MRTVMTVLALGVCALGCTRRTPVVVRTPAAAVQPPAVVHTPGLVCDTGVVSRATGFFRLEQDAGGAWRFVTPDGFGFFLAGNNGPVRMAGDFCPALGCAPYTQTLTAKYGNDRARWAQDVRARLLSWNFNAIGTWDPPAAGLVGGGLAHVRVLQLGKSFARTEPGNPSNLLDNVSCKGRFPNVFHPGFAAHCRRLAEKACAREKDNPWLVGWFTDNEIDWRGMRRQDANGRAEDARDGTGMFDAVARLPPEHPGRAALDRFLAARGTTADAAGTDDKQAFLRLVAQTYYRIATEAIRAVDPHHLILGCRFAGFLATPDIAWEEGGRWNDAMSVNAYPPADLTNGVVFAGWRDRRPIARKFREVYALARRPLLVTEWAYPALDTPCPCKTGAGQRVPTQTERAAASALYARTMIAAPEVVGYLHFRWVDEPAKGRWKMTGGEDCNYGLVNERDEPYALLTQALTDVQGRLYTLRPTLTR